MVQKKLPPDDNVHVLKIADAKHSIRHVFVRDLELDAHIGVYRHEKGRTQPIRINIDLTVREDTKRIDDELMNVVDYEQVVHQVRTIVDSGHLKLVETLAERIAQACLSDIRVLIARIRIEKLTAIEGARSVGVEIERARPDQ